VKNFEGVVPDGVIDAEVMARISQTMAEVISGLEEYEFKKATDSVMTLADYGNIYFQNHEPWKLIKNEKASAGSVLISCLQIAKALVIFMEPVMPAKMEAAWKQLGLEGSAAKCPSRKHWHPGSRPEARGPRDSLLSHGRAIRQRAG